MLLKSVFEVRTSIQRLVGVLEYLGEQDCGSAPVRGETEPQQNSCCVSFLGKAASGEVFNQPLQHLLC